MLLYKLLECNIKGKLYNTIKNMYHDNQCTVNINGLVTPWFKSNMGVKQGDCMSSTLFALYINDLAVEINKMNKGIDIDGYILSILLFVINKQILYTSVLKVKK